MQKRLGLDEVDVRVMSPKVIMLLSQFAYYIKRHDGIIIKLASKTVLKDVHEAHILVNDYILDDIYEQIVEEINSNTLNKRSSLLTRIKNISKPVKTKSADISPASISVYN